MDRFARWVVQTCGVLLPDYAALHMWSVEHLEDFWGAVWSYFGVVASVAPERVLASNQMPGARWFPGARLNYAENSLRAARTRPDAIAIVGEHESRDPDRWTWRELESRVAALARKLRQLGVEPGDRVAGVLPNIPETVAAMLATASVGAVWSVVNTDFGPSGVADRFAQIEPKVLFVVDGYEFGGTVRDMTGSYGDLLEVLPSVEQLIVVDQMPRESVGELPGDALRFSEIVTEQAEPRYEQLPVEHPLWILYSSGTTGKPKGIVHSHGGVALEFYKALALHAGLGPEDVAYYAVATTWLVWNMLAGILLTGAQIITYDGSPTFGGPQKSFELVARNRATFFGAGAGVLSMVQRAGVVPNVSMDFSALRSILVTGSPLPDATWDWVYEAVSDTVRLGSDSGGTDVTSAFIGTNPYQPVYRGEIMGPYLGVDAQSWNSRGERVWDEVGELVITRPMPSMPVFFWNDPQGERYQAAYFDMFPGVWRQGGLGHPAARGPVRCARPLGLHHQPRRHPDGLGGPDPRGGPRGWCGRVHGDRGGTGRRRLLHAAFRGAPARHAPHARARAAHRRRDPHPGLPALRPRRDHRGSRGSPHTHRQAAGDPGQEALPGRGPEHPQPGDRRRR